MSVVKDSNYGFNRREKKHFLELAFENKMKNMQDVPGVGNTATMSKIGSIHNKKVNYDVDECFFAKDDIPMDVRDKHHDILEFIDPDFLGMRKKDWNTSVAVPTNPQAEQDHQRKLLNIRIGLESHPIQKFKDHNIEPGVDLRNDYSGWNISTEIHNRQVRRNLQELDIRSAVTTQNFRNKYYFKTFFFMHKINYVF